MVRKNYIAVWVFLILGAAMQAQIISVQSLVSSDSMMIGDQIEYTIHVEAAENVTFRMPQLVDTLSRDLEVLGLSATDTSRVEGFLLVDHSYVITGFESGTQIVPSQPVIYRFRETTDTARSMPLLIHVFDPVVDTTQQIKPIKPPVNTPVSFREVIPWVALGTVSWLVATLIMALVWIYRQRMKDPEGFLAKPLEPAHVVAFRELDRLKEKKLWESGQVKSFYTRLTEISRHYIERQYGIPAMERTTEEILEAFRRSNTEDPLLDEMLKELLQLADLVKFAKEDPLPVDNQTNLNNAYLFVQKTYPLFYFETGDEIEEDNQDG